MVSPIFNQTEVKILPKQQEVWDKYCKIIQWGRRHPTRFIEEFVGLQLTDSQKYCFLSSWTVMYSIILMSRNSGKSFLSAPYVMARSLLIPNHKSYIMGPTGGQSAETASKLEALATGNIASVIGVSTMFLENAVAANSKVSAFTHAKDGVHVGLFNGSEVQSLTSVPNNLRGIRSNLVVFKNN